MCCELIQNICVIFITLSFYFCVFFTKVEKYIKRKRGFAPEYISEQLKKGRYKQTLKRKGK